MSTHRWMDKSNTAHPHTGYHSATERDEAPTQATVWMDLEDIVLNERRQTQKDTQCDSVYKKCPEPTDPQRRDVDLWPQSLSEGTESSVATPSPLSLTCYSSAVLTWGHPAPRGHTVMSGDICGCHTEGRELLA